MIINAKGKPCPLPVVEAKKALKKTNSVTVLTDNEIAAQNLEKMAKGMGFGYFCSAMPDGTFSVTISKSGAPPIVSETTFSEKEFPGDLVVTIGRNAMGGSGNDDELGKILIKGFVYSLTALEPPPKSVILFNSGVLLAEDGQNTVPDLMTLAEKGAEILCCGTCCNYFGIAGKLAAGTIIDMYGITERMAAAEKVINIT